MLTDIPTHKAISLTMVLFVSVAVFATTDLQSAESDLWTTQSGPGTIVAGLPFTITVGYGNNGPDTATSAYAFGYWTPPMGLDIVVDDDLNGQGAIFSAIQATADGTDTLGNFPLLFYETGSCEDLLFQLQGSASYDDQPPMQPLAPGESGSFSYDVMIPMENPKNGAVTITEPASLAQSWFGNTTSVFDAAGKNKYGRGSCENNLTHPDDPMCAYIDDNCFGARISQLAEPIEAEFELVNDGSADPTFGCEALVDFTPGNIALVRRGGCQFGTKAFNAELAQAAGMLLVWNTDCNGLSTSDQCAFGMLGGDLGGLVAIPVISLANADGEPIIAALENGEVVRGAFGSTTQFSAQGSVFLTASFDNDPDDSNDDSSWVQPILGEVCSFAIDPMGRSFPSGGGGGQIAVTTGDSCPWEATTDASWIVFPAGSGNTGSATLWYQVLTNEGPGRSTIIEIADQVHLVTQEAGNGCTYAIDPMDADFIGIGGNGAIEITTQPGCEWTATVSAPWLVLASPNTGTGTASLTYTVSPNPSDQRLGFVFVADGIHQVSQDALTGCDHGVVTDDGTPENGYGWGTGRIFVQEFTPTTYPYVITDVCAAFTQDGGDPTLAFDVVIYDDDGSLRGPGTLLGTVSSVVDDIPPWLEHTFASVDVEPAGVVVDEGSVFIGVGWNDGADAGFYVAADESPATQERIGFFGDNGVTWNPTDGIFPDYRSLMVRVDGQSPVDGEWEQVVGAAFGGGNGFGDAENSGAPTMATFQGGLYVGTTNQQGAQVRTSIDGRNWTPANNPGFGNILNHAVSKLIPFNGQLYASTLNQNRGTDVYRMSTPPSWTSVAVAGFGDSSNISAPSGAVFGGQLYFGTDNGGGCEIWRTTDGFVWTQVHVNGFGNAQNTVAESMTIYRGELVVGTRNADGAELWTSPDGVVWSQLITGGFGSPDNTAISDLAVFDNALYAGVSNSTTGAQVWRTLDGTTWGSVTDNGFGDARNTDFHSFETGDLGLHAAVAGPATPGTVWQSPHGFGWSVSSSPGFSNSDNEAIESLVFWNERVHAGTVNPESGCEIWRGGHYRLFGDGFETGDTSGWTTVAP